MLLPICGKLFERFILIPFSIMLMTTNLSNLTNLVFIDSCVNQLLAIVHETYTAVDANQTLETRGLYLDMSSAFHNVLCAGFIYELKSVGVLGNLLKLIKTVLNKKF